MDDEPTGQATGSEILCVWVNCASEDEAADIAAAAVAERLAASANIHTPVTSTYRWQGRVEAAREVPLLLKTRTELFADLARLVASLHSYGTPSIVGLRAEAAEEYAQWVAAETRLPGR